MLRPRQLPSVTLISVAWMLFLLSFFLPARNSQSGWETFTGVLTMILALPLLFFVEPKLSVVMIVPFANLLMLISPFLVYLLRDKSRILAVLLLASIVSTWFLPQGFLGEVAIGFYVWQGSFVAMSCGCILASFTLSSWDDIDNTYEAAPKELSLRRPKQRPILES